MSLVAYSTQGTIIATSNRFPVRLYTETEVRMVVEAYNWCLKHYRAFHADVLEKELAFYSNQPSLVDAATCAALDTLLSPTIKEVEKKFGFALAVEEASTKEFPMNHFMTANNFFEPDAYKNATIAYAAFHTLAGEMDADDLEKKWEELRRMRPAKDSMLALMLQAFTDYIDQNW